ncbi:hypothetical protein Dsin_015065 [Dipteronia sinensis]|uniref:S-protein homolog n=1 Tax=Dipteronia sinensis TaxID=43782 RepID=A0AAE0EC65_9ROSI|nr:hypothetical protein Dsin_015065 [Dipteronia sinensis]
MAKHGTILRVWKAGGGLLDPKVHLSIENNMGSGVDLTLHCKSKDDDLGEHKLPNSGKYMFQFRPNYWGTTLFFCSFAWPNAFHR